MPPFNFYRRRWYPNRRWRWRRRPRTWRPRQTIRRRFRRRRWVRRRRRFRKYHKKLKSIHLKEWQPQTVRKCKIKGNLCLLTCGKQRTNHNYILTSESLYPKENREGEDGVYYNLHLEYYMTNTYTSKIGGQKATKVYLSLNTQVVLLNFIEANTQVI